MSRRDNNSTGLGIAALGGGALLLWLIWRGRGKGKGKGDRAVEVWVRGGDRLEIDGIGADLATTVTRAHAAGKAHVHVAGDARQGWLDLLLHALRDAGVVFTLPADTMAR